ncbi:MAG: Ig-like domain-containing protein, partial [Ketobacteraceae bacterium]|nr:Ig-like domain-containing protein [Ketobacteraceae bacterium]
MKLRALLAATTVILTACGGGGGGSGVAEERPEGTANGIAQHGPIVNADVSAYDWNGQRGTHRGTTRTDGEGRYSLNISVPDRPLLIGSREGSYSEESTGRSVQMGNDELTAVIFYESGKNVDVQLTYFTTLATCRAEYLIGEKGLTVGNAINQANNEWSAILGVDIVGVQPVDVTKTSAFTPFMTPSHQYGVALAGVSELVNKIRLEDGADEDNTTYTVKYLTKVGCGDIRHDGALNGLGAPTAGNPSGQLYIGSTALTVDWYRRALGQGIIAFGSNENNKTGLDASHFLEMANTIALSSSAVFDGAEGSPVDNEGPIVTSILAEGSLVNGTASLTFEVSDPLGVKTVGFYIDDNFYADAQPGNPVLNWTTTAYSDGEHTVKVVATDVLDNPTEREFTFTVANTGPGLTITSPTLVNSTDYMATGTFSAVMADVVSVKVNGVEATINRENSTWSANLTLSGGSNDVQALIYDELDNSRAVDTVVRVDLFAPSITSWDTLAKLTNYDGLLNTCETVFLNAENSDNRPICLNAE